MVVESLAKGAIPERDWEADYKEFEPGRKLPGQRLEKA